LAIKVTSVIVPRMVAILGKKSSFRL